MNNYAQELRRCQMVLLLRAVVDAGGNQCAAARAAGVHRNTIWRAIHAAGYDMRSVKRLARQRIAEGQRKPVA
jgi:transcriptional regulator of acetoin/glycerol metabolism